VTPADLAAEDFCYLTTTGRRSGRPHEIEIWFAVGSSGAVLLISGGRDRSDWVRNLMADPAVTLRIGARTWDARARVEPEGSPDDVEARRLLVEKYATPSDDLVSWGRRSLVIAIDVAPASGASSPSR
jgi:deazaflavin-dependent oxidoreductase (nitroreductase family)